MARRLSDFFKSARVPEAVGAEPAAANAEPEAPRMIELAGTRVPAVPSELPQSEIVPEIFADLVLKLAHLDLNITTERVVQQLCLPLSIASALLEQLRSDHLLEVMGPTGPFNYRFAITDRGRQRATWLLENSQYVGPAPVSLSEYTRMLEYQFGNLPPVTADDVAEVLSNLVLPEQAREVVGLAVSAGRSLFVHGPPGGGKTSIGRQVHAALHGYLWLPYCIAVDRHIIRLFDARFHRRAPLGVSSQEATGMDQRWVRITRPFVVVGGELSLSDLDLTWDPGLGYHEAPPHIKANGGTFLLDDFGAQPVEPHRLLNRWIIPLEYRVDHLTLRTGQKLEVPFRQLLVISTNHDPEVVMTPALLRRMGYRVYVGPPTHEAYAEIFQRYARRHEVEVPPGLVEGLIRRYAAEQREIASCHPQDLIERARDICGYHDLRFALNAEVLDVAWKSYFGTAR